MDELRPGAWDRLIGERTAACRCAFLVDGTTPAEVRREIERRRAFWVSRFTSAQDPTADDLARALPGLSLLSADPRLTDEPLVRANDPLLIRLLIPFGFLIACYLMVIAVNSVRWFWLILPVALVAGVAARRRWWPARPALRARSIQCPDCGYDLTGLPDAIAPERTCGIHVGPHACPECGAGWPLIPPPVPVRPGADLPR